MRLTADIARIDAQFGNTALQRHNCQTVIKMNIRHQRHRALGYQLRHRQRRFLIIDRHPHNIAAVFRQKTNLPQRFCRVLRRRVVMD